LERNVLSKARKFEDLQAIQQSDQLTIPQEADKQARERIEKVG
jgi:hypothetical protein